MNVIAAEPLGIWDSRSRSWMNPLRPARTAWLKDHGLPANDMYRAEFYLIDAPFVRIYCYSVNGEGRRYLAAPHSQGEHDHSLCEVAVEPPRDVPLSELPPRELLQ